MRKLFVCILLASAIIAFELGCKKHTDNPVVASGPTLADSLRTTCVAPFVGHGDSTSIYSPTAFTPNGDGVNDLYSLIGKNVGPGGFSNLSIKIYDTTGTIVFQSTGTESPRWDGVDQNTHSQSTGYKYYVRIKYTTSGNITDSGSTYLYRLSGTTCIHTVAADTSKYRFPSQYDPLGSGFHPEWSAYENYCP